MRYSTALVLGTVVVGQAAAANRHATFHARRKAEAIKRGAEDVDWSKVSYDLSGVDWSKVFPTTPAPEAPAAPVTAAPATPVESTPANTPAAPSTPATVGGAVSDLLYGVDTIISKMGLKGAGVNSLTNNGGIWIGDDSAWKTQFTNDGSGDMVVFCWQANGFSGMSLNVNLPAISVGLKKGEHVTVSFGENVPAACAPAFADTKMAIFGGIDNTWYEATFGSTGAFDVSRNVNMKGNSITAKGSKCTSSMDTCVFQCQDKSVSSCETGYEIVGMSSAGCSGGFDQAMQGIGGGCTMGSTGETVQVTFS